MFRYLLLIIALLAVRCGSTQFFGGSKNSDDRAQPTSAQNQPQAPGTSPVGTTPGGSIPGVGGGVTTSSVVVVPGQTPPPYITNPFSPPGTIVSNPQPGNPYTTNTIFPGNNSNNRGVPAYIPTPNILSPNGLYPSPVVNPFGLPNPQILPSDPGVPGGVTIANVPESEITYDPSNPNQIIFGANSVFHVGDGRLDDTSSCYQSVKQVDVSGTRYFFEFEVLNESTTVNISIGRVCGVDLSLSNFISIGNLTKGLLGQTLLTPAANKMGQINPLVRAIFPAGKHWLVIDSTTKNQKDVRTDVSATDKDDFLIGAVTLNADKVIKPIRLGPAM